MCSQDRTGKTKEKQVNTLVFKTYNSIKGEKVLD